MTAPGTAPAVTEDQVRMALRRVKDPELNLNIVDLGLLYDVQVDAGADRATDPRVSGVLDP